MKQSILKFTGLLVLAGLLAGCGGSGSSPTEGAPGSQTIRITGNDQMQFNRSEIRAPAGEEVRLEFRNIGRMPKHTMGHNWVLFKQMEEDDLNRLAMEAARNEPLYLPNDRSTVLAYTQVLGPGESETITFTTPTEPGRYVYACTFPGHFAMMRGVLIVE